LIKDEKDSQKKHDLREKANVYLRRAEELAAFKLKNSDKSDNVSNYYTVRSYQNFAQSETSSSLSANSSISRTNNNNEIKPLDLLSNTFSTLQEFGFFIMVLLLSVKPKSVRTTKESTMQYHYVELAMKKSYVIDYLTEYLAVGFRSPYLYFFWIHSLD
jgi:hypothetical protein